MSRNTYPIAKRDKHGRVAVWLDFTTWLNIRDGLINSYLFNRRCTGRRRARKEAGKPDSILDCWPADVSQGEAALALYRVGLEAHALVYAGMGPKEFTNVETLQSMGDKVERESYEQQLQELIAKAKAEAAA